MTEHLGTDIQIRTLEDIGLNEDSWENALYALMVTRVRLRLCSGGSCYLCDKASNPCIPMFVCFHFLSTVLPQEQL